MSTILRLFYIVDQKINYLLPPLIALNFDHSKGIGYRWTNKIIPPINSTSRVVGESNGNLERAFVAYLGHFGKKQFSS